VGRRPDADGTHHGDRAPRGHADRGVLVLTGGLGQVLGLPAGGRQDLVWGGGGEHLTCAGRVQHPDPDETTVQRFVTGASPGNHRDLSGAGGFCPEDHAMGVIDTDVLVSGIHALESLGQNIVGRIDQLLHGGAPAPLRSFIPDARAKLLVNQARSA